MDTVTKLLNTPNVHPGNEPLVQPIYQTSVFQMHSYKQAIDCEHDIRPKAYYTRWGNPTIAHLENQLLAMSNYQECLVFPSGMSAITTVFLSLVKSGDHIFISDRLYGDSIKFFIEEMVKFDVTISFFNILKINDIAEYKVPIKRRSFIYFESLSNPGLVLADFDQIRSIAIKLNATTICDATFTPSPNLVLELSEYIDITIHSLTKYISGHFTSFGGAALTSSTLADPIWHLQTLYGCCPDPHACWLVSQGIKTLCLRLKEQNQSALKIASYLNKHPKIHSVMYPLLDSNCQYPLASNILTGGGGVVSFSLKDQKKSSVVTLLEKTRIIGLFVSLGGVHSCIEHAQTMSHSMLNENSHADFCQHYISENLIRLSVGLENVNDLINDLDQALALL